MTTAASPVRELTDATFPAAVASGVVLVDFYGTYCPPCRLLDPVLESLAADFAGRAAVARINVDEHSEAAVDNAVDDIPTLIFFKDGKEEVRLFGAQGADTLAGELRRLLAQGHSEH